MTDNDYKQRCEYAKELINKHIAKVSSDNLFYDWRIETPKVEQGKEYFLTVADLYVKEKITEPQYLSGLYSYFQIVYDETLRLWEENKTARRIEYAKTYIQLPCDVKLSAKELLFCNERWNNWEAKENAQFLYFDEIDNDIGIIEYPNVIVPKIVITDENHIINFGKYGQYGALGKYRPYRIKELFETDPQYLLWAAENIPKFKLADELLLTIQKWDERFQARKARDRYDNKNKRRDNRESH
jgi:hypothetical protein